MRELPHTSERSPTNSSIAAGLTAGSRSRRRSPSGRWKAVCACRVKKTDGSRCIGFPDNIPTHRSSLPHPMDCSDSVDLCSAETLWRKCQASLEAKIGSPLYAMWFSPESGVLPLSYDGTKLTLGFPPETYILWAENYRPQVQAVLAEVTGKADSVVEFAEIPAERLAELKAAAPKTAAPKAAAAAKPSAPSAAATESQKRTISNLNRHFSFENFVVGRTNEFAFNTCREVAAHPGDICNPLFIHGPSGMGKTHLMQSIARQVCRDNKNAVVEYMTSEQFGNLYVESFRNNNLPAFRQRFRNVDVLLLDDVQFFAGKERMQEEFFHTFNALYDAKKQIVCASDQIPQEIGELSQRLVSRFQGGLVVDITPPDLQTRIAILHKKEEKYKDHKLSDEIINYLANRIRSNVRNLESSLLTLHAYMSMSVGDKTLQEELTMEKVDEIMGSRFEQDAACQLSLTAIIEGVAHHFDVRIQDLKGKGRQAEITIPRQVAMYLSRKLTDKSLPAIADGFNKSHPTVLHAINAVEKKMDNSDEFRQTVATIERSLTNS